MADEYGFHREAILTGCVDSFCLACEEYLKCERDITTHVTKPVHRKNLLTVHYVDKYHDDHIRKVKKSYFCELCNLLLPTVTKVGLHVAETLHVDNKATKLLRRIGNTVIALGNVSISERAWHGLMEDTCAICNVEYDNEDIHKNQPSHIIRLIQCKVQYDANKTIYRLIDNDTFQCLTCNMVLPLKAITGHFNNTDHQKLYSECLASANTEKLNNPAINNINNNGDQESIEKRNDLTKQDNTNEHVRILEKTADSALSYPTVDQKHKKTRLYPSDESTSEPKTSECTRNTKTDNINKQLKHMGWFLVNNEWMTFIIRTGEEFLVINKKIILDVSSFTLITKLGSTMRCEGCNVNITNNDNVGNHVMSSSHMVKMGEIPVIIYLDTEFVREVRPGFYHCGYCHKLVYDWNNLLNHLQCPEHTSVKLRAKLLLDKLLREMGDDPDRRSMIDRVIKGNPFF